MTNEYRVPVAQGDRIRAGLAMQLIAITTDVPIEDMGPRIRVGPRACRARWLSMYLAHVGFGWPLERVGHAFGLNRATAATACRWAEDARDRSDVDGLLDRLERMVRDLCDTPALELAS